VWLADGIGWDGPAGWRPHFFLLLASKYMLAPVGWWANLQKEPGIKYKIYGQEKVVVEKERN
jgi:hypothetical protein